MTEDQARQASENVLSLAGNFPLPARRVTWSGLIEQQALEGLTYARTARALT